MLLVGRFVPTKVIRVRNKDKPWFDDQCRHAFGLKQEVHLFWTSDRSRVNLEEFLRCQVWANETYSEAKRQFIYRNRDVLMNARSPHKWWFTLKSAMFGLSSSLPPLVGGGGGLMCRSVGKADLLSDHFDGKQSRESVDLPLICHPSPRLTSFAFRLNEVRRLLLDLDPYGALTHWECVLFFKRIADVLAPGLSVVFRRLVRLASFPACWSQANVTHIPKGPPSSSVANYRPISIISELSTVFERLVSVRLRRFMEHSGVRPTTQFAYRKGLGTYNALFVFVAYTEKCIGDWAGG